MAMLKCAGHERSETTVRVVNDYRKRCRNSLPVKVKKVPVMRVADVAKYYFRSVEFFLFFGSFMPMLLRSKSAETRDNKEKDCK
jgi:hypothetical protein